MPKQSTKPSSIFSPSVAELVAIGAAIGANCEPCFKYHYRQARKLGVSRDDVIQAVELADNVKRAPAQNMLTLADKILQTNLAEKLPEAPASECCAGNTPKPAKRKCC